MNKKDLVAGKHVVKLRNGDNYLVLDSDKYGLLFLSLNRRGDFNRYNKDLTHVEFSNLDIVKVGLIDFGVLNDLQDDSCIKWIWERKEPKYNVGDVLRCVEKGKCWKKGELCHIVFVGETSYSVISNLDGSNYVLFKSVQHNFKKVDINTLTLHELIKLGYEIKVVEK